MNELARTGLGLLLLAAVACLVPLVDGVRQGRAVVWSAARGAVQLLAVGLLLGAVFPVPVAVLPVVAVMVAAAIGTVAPRLAGLPARGRWRRRWTRPARPGWSPFQGRSWARRSEGPAP
jgi:ABC-type iron transport system FetAB permease component